MAENTLFKGRKLNPEDYLKCIQRQGTPEFVHFQELFLDEEVKNEIIRKFALANGSGPDDPFAKQKQEIRLQRFLGYEYVVAGVEGLELPLKFKTTADTAEIKKDGGNREFIEESRGPITTWEEFEAFPWPDPKKASVRTLEWYERNLPDDMVLIGGLTGHILEYLCWLMGYETLCYSLYEKRDLVRALYERILEINTVYVEHLLSFDRVKIVWGSDDMGFKTGPLLGPKDLREFVFPAHKALARLCHEKGRLYFLHACGNLELVMDDLINDVGIDAKHSFEDTIEKVEDAKKRYGGKICLLGGIDVDFLCRASEERIRTRVRNTLNACMPGGGYCFGTGNSVANYIPLKNYLVMLDEASKYKSR